MKHIEDQHDAAGGHVDTFITETEGLAEASSPSLVQLSDGDHFPGLWMAHCHIAEHNQSGMMFSFNVSRLPEASPA